MALTHSVSTSSNVGLLGVAPAHSPCQIGRGFFKRSGGELFQPPITTVCTVKTNMPGKEAGHVIALVIGGGIT
jgi:hypothetical protein